MRDVGPVLARELRHQVPLDLDRICVLGEAKEAGESRHVRIDGDPLRLVEDVADRYATGAERRADGTAEVQPAAATEPAACSKPRRNLGTKNEHEVIASCSFFFRPINYGLLNNRCAGAI